MERQPRDCRIYIIKTNKHKTQEWMIRRLTQPPNKKTDPLPCFQNWAISQTWSPLLEGDARFQRGGTLQGDGKWSDSLQPSPKSHVAIDSGKCTLGSWHYPDIHMGLSVWVDRNPGDRKHHQAPLQLRGTWRWGPGNTQTPVPGPAKEGVIGPQIHTAVISNSPSL